MLKNEIINYKVFDCNHKINIKEYHMDDGPHWRESLKLDGLSTGQK